MSYEQWATLTQAAADDVRFADAMERAVSDAVDEALGTTETGAEHGLAGHLAGRRFRDKLASPPDASGTGGNALMPPISKPLTTEGETTRRADAFRRMAGVRV